MFAVQQYNVTTDQWLAQGTELDEDAENAKGIVLLTRPGKPLHAEFNELTNEVEIWFLVNIDSGEMQTHLIWVVGTNWKLPIHRYDHISTLIVHRQDEEIGHKRHIFHVLEEIQ